MRFRPPFCDPIYSISNRGAVRQDFRGLGDEANFPDHFCGSWVKGNWFSFSEHSLHQLHQLSVAIHHLIPDLFVGDSRKELSRAGDFGFFDFTKLHRRQVAFGFGDEIDMFHLVLFEGDGPIRIVIPDRCWDEEGLRQLGINDNLRAGIEIAHEVPFDGRIREDVVVDMVISLESLDEVTHF